MKYVFILVLLILAGAAGLMGAVVVYRFTHNMTQTPKIVPGERVFAMPANVVPRGGELVIPKEQRDIATKRANPIKPSPASIQIGREHYQTFCGPCHGPEVKGGVTRLVRRLETEARKSTEDTDRQLEQDGDTRESDRKEAEAPRAVPKPKLRALSAEKPARDGL